MLAHVDAFKGQFLAISAYASTPIDRVGWIRGEVEKYLGYYKRTPLLGVSIFALGALSIAWAVKQVKAGGLRKPDNGKILTVARLSVIGLLGPIILGTVSGHHGWHHLLVAPFWAMLAGTGWYAATMFPLRPWLRSMVLTLIVATVLTSGATSWIERSFLVYQGGSSRRMEPVTEKVAQLIPRGSHVYGDHRLIFLAEQQDWRFVGFHNALFNVLQSEALAKESFEYVVLSDLTGKPKWLHMENYAEVAEVSGPGVRLKLPALYSRLMPGAGEAFNAPVSLVVYRLQ